MTEFSQIAPWYATGSWVHAQTKPHAFGFVQVPPFKHGLLAHLIEKFYLLKI